MTDQLELPLFPHHSVLCPGVALPLHIFEERYRQMVARCLERDEPFGVVLIEEGREVGPMTGRIAEIGTTAVISEVGRYPDGRMDLMTVGGRRFRVRSLEAHREPFLVGSVELLDEPIGDADVARFFAQRVSRRFLRYLELLEPALTQNAPDVEIEVVESVEPEGDDADEDDDATTAVVEVEIEVADPGDPVVIEIAQGTDEPDEDPGKAADEDTLAERIRSATDDERHSLLMAAARRLAVPDDPTVLSYIIGGLVQIELPARQRLLEAADAETRLRDLDGLLGREIQLLGRRLKPLLLDPRMDQLRRN
jgi:Lon protease-like protein